MCEYQGIIIIFKMIICYSYGFFLMNILNQFSSNINFNWKITNYTLIIPLKHSCYWENRSN